MSTTLFTLGIAGIVLFIVHCILEKKQDKINVAKMKKIFLLLDIAWVILLILAIISKTDIIINGIKLM